MLYDEELFPFVELPPFVTFPDEAFPPEPPLVTVCSAWAVAQISYVLTGGEVVDRFRFGKRCLERIDRFVVLVQ